MLSLPVFVIPAKAGIHAIKLPGRMTRTRPSPMLWSLKSETQEIIVDRKEVRESLAEVAPSLAHVDIGMSVINIVNSDRPITRQAIMDELRKMLVAMPDDGMIKSAIEIISRAPED